MALLLSESLFSAPKMAIREKEHGKKELPSVFLTDFFGTENYGLSLIELHGMETDIPGTR
ncbi:MAG: hypothetical protein NPIRA01_34050 [Nitrospirales bacterium]|nr:MAG: hypothetical protein NPIRA01_34050 [Nitrospirales bacterium]